MRQKPGMAGILRAFEAFVFNKTAPLSEAEEDEQSHERTGDCARSVRGHKCTILAIDDDPTFLQTLRPLLRDEGFNVLTSTSGAKGLDMLRYARLDIRVVLLDYNMPQLNGAETLKHLRQLNQQVKVIALSGVDVRLLPPSFHDGVDKFIQKPFRSKELVESINTALGNGSTSAATSAA